MRSGQAAKLSQVGYDQSSFSSLLCWSMGRPSPTTASRISQRSLVAPPQSAAHPGNHQIQPVLAQAVPKSGCHRTGHNADGEHRPHHRDQSAAAAAGDITSNAETAKNCGRWPGHSRGTQRSPPNRATARHCHHRPERPAPATTPCGQRSKTARRSSASRRAQRGYAATRATGNYRTLAKPNPVNATSCLAPRARAVKAAGTENHRSAAG